MDSNDDVSKNEDRPKMISFGMKKSFKPKIIKSTLFDASSDDKQHDPGPSTTKHFIKGLSQSVIVPVINDDPEDKKLERKQIVVKPQFDRNEPLPEPQSVDSYPISPDNFGWALLKASGHVPGGPVGGRNKRYVEPCRKKPIQVNPVAPSSSTSKHSKESDKETSKIKSSSEDIFVKDSHHDNNKHTKIS